MFTLTGTIFRKFDIQYVGERQYRTFWLKTQERKSQYIRMQVKDENCDHLDTIELGELVLVKFSISGKPKFMDNREDLYNNINVSHLESVE